MWRALWQLRSSDPSKRERAVAMLAESSGDRAVEALVRTLTDTDERVRGAAATALGELGKPDDVRIVDTLFKATGDEKPSVGEAAVAALAKLAQSDDARIVGAVESPADRSVEALIRTVTNTNERVRGAAAVALGSLGRPSDTRIVDALLKAAGDRTSSVRDAATEAFGKLARSGDVRIVDALIRALGNEHWNVRWAAAKALASLGDARALDALVAAAEAASDPVELRSFIDVLSRFGGPKVIDRLIAALDHMDGGVRSDALVALSRMGDYTTNGAFIREFTALRDRAMATRVGVPLEQMKRWSEAHGAALQELARVPCAIAVPPLLGLHQRDWETVIPVLALRRDSHAAEVLSDYLRRGAGLDVARVLRQFDDDRARAAIVEYVGTLVGQAESQTAPVAAWAIGALCEFDDDRARAAIVEYVGRLAGQAQSRTAGVERFRVPAIRELASLGRHARSALPVLESLLDDKASFTKRWVVGDGGGEPEWSDNFHGGVIGTMGSNDVRTEEVTVADEARKAIARILESGDDVGKPYRRKTGPSPR